MQATTFPVTALTSPAPHSVVPQLQRSEIFREYQQAFETTTGLPLALRPTGTFQSPLHASKRANAFCALLAGSNATCAACLRLQQRVEVVAADPALHLREHSPDLVPLAIGEADHAVGESGSVL